MALAVVFYFLSEWIRPFLDENLVSILVVNTLILVAFLGSIFVWEKKMIMGIIKG